MCAVEHDRFKEEFKYFKRKNPMPDLSCVLDFDDSIANPKVFEISGIVLKDSNNQRGQDRSAVGRCETCCSLGLRDHHDWSVFSLHSNPGFLFVRNPFLVSGQQYWVKRSLEKYPLKPNHTNLDAHFENPGDVWSEQWAEDTNKRMLLHKLRWVTLGYHHNWDTKVYSVDQYSDFPPCLLSISRHVASVLGFSEFNPEAAIVNYYHMDSSLGGHVDYSEYDQTAPIISFSFGQTAVFLLGAQSRADRPVALFIRSGDIVVMSGECRLSYHAVPLLLKECVEDRYSPALFDDSWSPFAKYLCSSRININVRQVFPS